MSDLTIVCDNCGAKYRLPASFSGEKAKCKQCGSVIDVAAQRTAAAAPKPASPPSAVARTSSRSAPKDATAASERPSRAGRAAKADADGTKTSRRGSRDQAEAGAEGGRRGRGERGDQPEKKNNTMLLVGGGVGALAIVAVIAVLSFGKKDTPQETNTAAEQTTAPAKPATPVAEPTPTPTPPPAAPVAAPTEPKTEPPAAEKPQPSPGAADAAPATASDASANGAPAKPATAPAAGHAPAADPQKRWERLKTKSLDEVFDPKTLGDVTWPSDIPDALKTEIAGLVADVQNGGRAGITAKPKLEKIGYAAIFGIVDQLRKLDYKSSSDQVTAWEYNKVLDTICLGINAGFVAVNDGEELDPRKADWNAQTNRAWGQMLSKWPSEQAFEEWRKTRLDKGEKK